MGMSSTLFPKQKNKNIISTKLIFFYFPPIFPGNQRELKQKAYLLNLSKSSSKTVASTSANNSNRPPGSDPGPDPVLSSFSLARAGLYRNKSYKNLPWGVNIKAYIGESDMKGTLGVTKVEVISPGDSQNLCTSLVNRPWRNLTVSGPRNRTTDLDLRSEAMGPTWSKRVWWVEKCFASVT